MFLRNKALRVSLGVGATAAARTAILFALVGRVQRTGLPIIDDVLWMGVKLVLLPFGGVSETALPTWAKVALGSLLNGILWFVVGLLAVVIHKRLRSETPPSAI